MRVLNLSYDDYANFAFDNCKAFKSVGIDAVSFKKVKHPFGYDQESTIGTVDQIKREIQKADIIQLFHSDGSWLNYAYDLGKRVVVYHTGTAYRQNPNNCNIIFNGFVERCFTDQCEFIGLGMKNETYIATAVDTDKIIPGDWKTISPYLVAHYPSNPTVKGTAKIIEMCKSIDGLQLIVSEERLKHEAQLKRMSSCDIYVELFNTTQNGKPYGCFGVTAFEAAALGKIVITNNINEKAYSDQYGDCALVIANTEEAFISKLTWLNGLNENDLLNLQEQTREWIVKNHSYIATGNKLKTLLNI